MRMHTQHNSTAETKRGARIRMAPLPNKTTPLMAVVGKFSSGLFPALLDLPGFRHRFFGEGQHRGFQKYA